MDLTCYGRLAAIGLVEELVVTQTSFAAAEEDFWSVFLLHTFAPDGGEELEEVVCLRNKLRHPRCFRLEPNSEQQHCSLQR